MASESLRDQVIREIGARDPAMVDMAVAVALDLAALQAAQLAGQDVSRELAIAQAAAANLSEHARNTVVNLLMEHAAQFLRRAVLAP
jgi:hypothetical protein